ncbi:MAG: hypothetical protein M1127_01420 [Patescibacteria group bacterium]|nr:hypothetical protein [Patescibacteria group bacterium]
MLIKHSLSDKIFLQEETKEPASFLLTNKIGGYLWLAEKPQSRYGGWFFSPEGSLGEQMIKVLDSIDVLGEPQTTKINNNFWNIERQRGSLTEKFFLPSRENCLVYEASHPVWLEIVFDVKATFDNDENGRTYEMFLENGTAVVGFHSQKNSLPDVFTAVRSKSGEWEKIGQWARRDYPFDKNRSSAPFEKYVFRGLRIKTEQLVFALASSKEEAAEKAGQISENLSRLEQQKKETTLSPLLKKYSAGHNQEKETVFAYLAAVNSLSGLATTQNGKQRLFAGLPWFFRFWLRDSAFCLKALAKIDIAFAREILWQLASEIFLREKHRNQEDGSGWLFKSIGYFLANKKLYPEEIKKIKTAVEKELDFQIKEKTANGWVIQENKTSWMDTLERNPVCLEQQALRLNMYKLARKLNGNPAKKFHYWQMETQLKNKIKKTMWDGKVLADGFNPSSNRTDWTMRPNVFLAFYVYPRLLSRNEWEKCFEKALEKLWLPWGGLATLDKTSPLFQPRHTGENPASYHQGDSWFWINNVAATCLLKTDCKKFRFYIEKILKKSSQEILWKAGLGHLSELSSSGKCEPGGSVAQAWSAASFIELYLTYRKYA